MRSGKRKQAHRTAQKLSRESLRRKELGQESTVGPLRRSWRLSDLLLKLPNSLLRNKAERIHERNGESYNVTLLHEGSENFEVVNRSKSPFEFH